MSSKRAFREGPKSDFTIATELRIAAIAWSGSGSHPESENWDHYKRAWNAAVSRVQGSQKGFLRETFPLTESLLKTSQARLETVRNRGIAHVHANAALLIGNTVVQGYSIVPPNVRVS